MNKLTWLKVLFISLSLGMVYLAIDTSMKSNIFVLKIDEPWFTTTLFDFYFNIVVFSAWVIYKERIVLQKVLWILAFIILGSIATCLYVALQLFKLKPGDSLDKVVLRNGA